MTDQLSPLRNLSFADEKYLLIDGDVILVGHGTVTSVTVAGTWYYITREQGSAFRQYPMSNKKISDLTRLDLKQVPVRSCIEVKGDLYFHPDACLVQEGWGSYSRVEKISAEDFQASKKIDSADT